MKCALKARNGKRSRESGFTLVELMVSMIIGLFIIGGLIAIVVTSTSAYNVQLDHARVNENARFATEFLSRDIRMAGYYGCLNNLENVTNNLVVGSVNLYDITDSIEGSEGHANGSDKQPQQSAWLPSDTPVSSLNILPGTDAITVRFANPTESAKLDEPSSPNSPIPTNVNEYKFKVGQLAVVSDCDKADVFQITGTDVNGNLAHAGGGDNSPGNLNSSLGGSLGDGYNTLATVMSYNAVRYFVRQQDESDNDPNAPVALYREYIANSGDTEVEQLIEGVENMQILYGEDTDIAVDGIANSYVTADKVGTWRNVVGVQIALLIRSNEEYGLKEEASGFNKSIDKEDFKCDHFYYELLDQDVCLDSIVDDEKPRFRRRKFSTIIALRNGQ